MKIRFEVVIVERLDFCPEENTTKLQQKATKKIQPPETKKIQ